MQRIENEQLKTILPYFQAAAKQAGSATCNRASCGAVIVNKGLIIGEGYNGPAKDAETNRTCGEVFDYAKRPKYDLTCCIHAEWRAILETCKHHGSEIEGATLYFLRINETGEFTDAGEPYCTVCSRLALEAGLKEFALWNRNGADIYPLEEYNRKSYDYYRQST